MIEGFSHNHWIREIKKYTGETNDDNVIKFALSYTLQSLRNSENLQRFKWQKEDIICAKKK